MNVGVLLLLAGAAWMFARTPRGLPPAGAVGEPSLYTVQPGESLSSIARDQLEDLTRWQELASLNDLMAPYIVQPGQQILMPADY